MSTIATEEEIFDPEFLSRLRALFFKLRKRRQQQKRGLQAMPAAGHTREFKDHRHYTRNDDFRSIDWRIYARLDRLFVRVFEEVQEFHVHILLDRSRSMLAPHPGKRRLALRLGVALAYLALVADHRVSFHTLAEDCRRELEPIKGQGHIHEVIQEVLRIPFEGATDLAGALHSFRPGKDRRGIVFILSDFFGRDPATTVAELQIAQRFPAETHLIHILDPQERECTYDGELLLEDVETGETRRLHLSAIERQRYHQRFAAWQQELANSCLARSLDYLVWTTDRDFEEAFIELLSRGSQLAGS